MCARLANMGITDKNVLDAMTDVPRHWFIDSLHKSLAYEDVAISIDCEQTISRPSTVAIQSQALEVKKDMKVLEVGTGSGYQTAILCAMGARVFTIERQHGLFIKTKALLDALHYKAKCFLGDGYKGLTEVDYSPYDRIIITCGAPYVPEALMKQLKVGGIMVIPVGEQQQEMLSITKNGESPEEWIQKPYGNFKFVPMLDGRQFQHRRRP